MTAHNTPELRQALQQELITLEQQLRIELAQDHHFQGLLQRLELTPLSDWPELLSHWQTPHIEQRTQRLEAIQAALSQMDLGMYGLCCDCEQRIRKEDLIKDPARQRCHRCQPDALAHHPFAAIKAT